MRQNTTKSLHPADIRDASSCSFFSAQTGLNYFRWIVNQTLTADEIISQSQSTKISANLCPKGNESLCDSSLLYLIHTCYRDVYSSSAAKRNIGLHRQRDRDGDGMSLRQKNTETEIMSRLTQQSLIHKDYQVGKETIP